MSREKTRMPVISEAAKSSGRIIATQKEATILAQEIVNTIGEENLVDIKFLIDPSSATREEILAAALKWVKNAEEKFAEGTLLPLNH